VTRILAIDPSLTATGTAVTNMLDALVVETIKPKVKGTNRLMFIRGELSYLINSYAPDVIVMEGYNYGAARMKGAQMTPGRLFDIGELGGMIKMLAWHHKLPILIVPPASLKMFVAGNGAAKKPQMMVAVKEQWRTKIRDDNQADAVGLYYFAQATLEKRKRRRYTEKQRSALDGAKWEGK
jgi:Holliday junction resolvasome RuvABC endonuclease subunit